jgi:hypothetical protein
MCLKAVDGANGACFSVICNDTDSLWRYIEILTSLTGQEIDQTDESPLKPRCNYYHAHGYGQCLCC